MKKAFRKPMTFQKKLLIVFMIGYFVIVLALATYSSYLSQHYRKGIEQSGNAMLNLYVNELDTLLKTSKKYLQEIILQDTNVQILQSNSGEVMKYEAAYELIRSLDTQLTLKEEIAGFMVRYEEDNCYYIFQESIAFEEKQKIKIFIDEQVASSSVERVWKVIRGDRKTFLALTYSVNGTYITIIIDFEKVTSRMVDKYAQSSAEIVFEDEEGILNSDLEMDGREEVYEVVQEHSELQDILSHDGAYMVFANYIENTALQMYVILPNESGITKQESQFYIIGIIFLAVICVIFSYCYLKREFFVPLQSMMGTMEKIEEGQVDAEMEENFDIVEYKKTAITFNSMMRQLKAWKIKAYEEEIKEQKTRLQYLQLQIKPHFFLNCLKTLYALLQQGKTKALEDVLFDTSKYFRYIFRDSFTLVELREELNFTQEYLDIQRNSAGQDIDYEVVVDRGAMDAKVLPLSVQTFVENSVKYALSNEKLRIQVTVNILEGEEERYLDLVVADNGQGYAREWLERMNEKDYQTQDGEHVGVLNLKKRLYLYYGDTVEFAVRNHGGAISEVVVPVGKDQQQKMTDKDVIQP